MIPYEADPITDADPALICAFGLTPGAYGIVVARPEPENSLLEIVEAFSRRRRGIKLVVLGNFTPDLIRYHKRVIDAAGPEILFAGAIYDKSILASLRFFARVYIHGHRVGGTNPSLVESLAAGNPIIAHDNCYTRWVAGPAQRYFSGADDLSDTFDQLLEDFLRLEQMGSAARNRHLELFTPAKVLPEYERLLIRLVNFNEAAL